MYLKAKEAQRSLVCHKDKCSNEKTSETRFHNFYVQWMASICPNTPICYGFSVAQLVGSDLTSKQLLPFDNWCPTLAGKHFEAASPFQAHLPMLKMKWQTRGRGRWGHPKSFNKFADPVSRHLGQSAQPGCFGSAGCSPCSQLSGLPVE